MAYPTASADSVTSTSFVGNADADVFIPEIWTKEVVRARQSRLVFSKLVNRGFEEDVVNYGDKVNIPAVSHLTAQAKSTETAISYEALTETNTQLTINQWYYSAVAQESITKRQSIHDMLKVYAPEQGYALALIIDDALTALVDDAPTGANAAVGTLAVGLQYTDVTRAMQYLDDADVPMADRNIAISPAEFNNFRNLDQFTNADYSKLNSDVTGSLKDAYAGRWLQTPVWVTTNLDGTNAAGHDNVIMHKDAFALVLQMEPTTHMFFDIDYFAEKVAVEQLYGVLAVRYDHYDWMKGL